MSIKRQTVWSLAPLLVVTLLSFFTAPLFVKYLGSKMYALWNDVSTFSGAFGFMDLGLGVAVGRYVGVALGSGDKAAVRQYWGTGNVIAIPLLLGMAAVFAWVGVSFGPRWFVVDAEHVDLMRWAFLFGGFNLFLSYYNSFWLVLSQAHLDFGFLAVLRSVLNLVQVPFTLWLAYVTGSPVAVIVGTAGITLVQLLIFVWHAARHYGLRLNLRDASVARAKEMAVYTGKTFGTLLAGSFLGASDRMVLGRLAPQEHFTLYAFCNNFGMRIQGLGGAIMGPVFHQTNRAVGSERGRSAAAIYNETFEFTFGWYALLAIWVACWHPVFLRIWLRTNPALIPGVMPLFVPIVISFCLGALANISNAQLASLNRVGVDMAFTIANGAARAACVIAGWYWNGLTGAAWGVLASRVVTVIQDLYAIRIVGGGGWLSWRTWGHLVAQIGIGAAFLVASRLMFGDSLWAAIPAVLHGCIVAVWLLRHAIRKYIFLRPQSR